MQRVFLAAATATLATASFPADASVFSFGSSMARSCYLAAAARSPTRDALNDCNLAFAVEPMPYRDRVATHVNRGILRMVDGRLTSARHDFERALTLDPNQPEAWLNLGILHYKLGDNTSALRHFERAIELNTSDPALAYFARGLANEDSGNLRAAYADLRRAQSLRPGWALPAQELSRYRVIRR